MSNQTGCTFCENSDPKRTKDGKIRCTAYSEWREPLGEICESFFDRGRADLLAEIKRLKEET